MTEIFRQRKLDSPHRDTAWINSQTQYKNHQQTTKKLQKQTKTKTDQLCQSIAIRKSVANRKKYPLRIQQ